MAVRAYLALGSNMGEREQQLVRALKALQAAPGITVTALSKVYETEPVGYVEQGAFLNMVAAIETELPPLALLETVLAVEQELGRVRTVRWGPRTIDIDILLYGEERIDLPHLQIPHPEMTRRAFVLVPLADVWHGGPLPFWGQTIEACIRLAEDAKGVQTWGTLDWETGFDLSAN
ncbi:2-amino-4-hydroxy-6-hydroxymethyldihydropteridine diphosphokinase [Brevibacillus sp. SYP-B805]|nr:2-amino-4-hydroxy-6-hydroxymethyldihydropteridine diphosphokinase [Brevibacillus sp. SYP-B805]